MCRRGHAQAVVAGAVVGGRDGGSACLHFHDLLTIQGLDYDIPSVVAAQLPQATRASRKAVCTSPGRPLPVVAGLVGQVLEPKEELSQPTKTAPSLLHSATTHHQPQIAKNLARSLS